MLGYDLRNESVTDRVWSIISNKEVLRVNRAWFGHPGRQVATGIGGNGAVEVWAKQIAKGEIAVFALNAGTTSANATLSLADVGAPHRLMPMLKSKFSVKSQSFSRDRGKVVC